SFGTMLTEFAAIFYMLNHTTFNGSLFMVAGIVDQQTGTRDILKLAGLLKLLLITTILALIDTYSKECDYYTFLHVFNSKKLFFDAMMQLTEGAHALTIFLHEAILYLVVFGSIFTFVYSLYLFFGVFTGPKQLDKLPLKPVEARFGMLLSPIILIL